MIHLPWLLLLVLYVFPCFHSLCSSPSVSLKKRRGESVYHFARLSFPMDVGNDGKSVLVV